MINVLLILPSRSERRFLGKQPRVGPGAPSEGAPTKADLWRGPEHQHRQLIGANGSVGEGGLQQTSAHRYRCQCQQPGGTVEAVYIPARVQGRKLVQTPAAEALGSNGSLHSDQQTTSVVPAAAEAGLLSWCLPDVTVTRALPGGVPARIKAPNRGDAEQD